MGVCGSGPFGDWLEGSRSGLLPTARQSRRLQPAHRDSLPALPVLRQHVRRHCNHLDLPPTYDGIQMPAQLDRSDIPANRRHLLPDFARYAAKVPAADEAITLWSPGVKPTDFAGTKSSGKAAAGNVECRHDQNQRRTASRIAAES